MKSLWSQPNLQFKKKENRWYDTIILFVTLMLTPRLCSIRVSVYLLRIWGGGTYFSAYMSNILSKIIEFLFKMNWWGTLGNCQGGRGHRLKTLFLFRITNLHVHIKISAFQPRKEHYTKTWLCLHSKAR